MNDSAGKCCKPFPEMALSSMSYPMMSASVYCVSVYCTSFVLCMKRNLCALQKASYAPATMVLCTLTQLSGTITSIIRIQDADATS